MNRKDRFGKNVFEGGFLGLDNIGVFDRSAPLPTGGHLEQADGTAWMALFSQNMLELAVELAAHDPTYEDMVSKFAEHFYYIAAAMNRPGRGRHVGRGGRLLLRPAAAPRRQRHAAQGALDGGAPAPVRDDRDRGVAAGARPAGDGSDPWNACAGCPSSEGHPPHGPGTLWRGGPGDLALLNPERLRRILTKMLDENEFLSPYGIRSLSRFHERHPYVFHVDGQEYRVDYLPAESNTGMFGGNSNWRGPVWMPVNALIIRALLNFYLYYGDNFKIECPTGSGKLMNLFEVSKEIADRLGRIFLRDEHGRRPVYGGRRNSRPIPTGATTSFSTSTSTATTAPGWAQATRPAGPGSWPRLIQLYGLLDPKRALEVGKQAGFVQGTRGPGGEEMKRAGTEETMKAITVEPKKAGTARLEEIPEPDERDGSVLVEAVAVGVCGTDIEIVEGLYGWAPPGKTRLVLGHESLGRVIDPGPRSGFRKGDLVVGIVRRPDPVPCPNCAVGEWDMCRNGRYTERGIKEIDGFMSERWRIEPEYAMKVDPSLGLLGVLIEPTSVVAKAWEQIAAVGQRSFWKPRTVLVTGAGPIGLLAALIGKQHGGEIHVLDRVESGAKPESGARPRGDIPHRHRGGRRVRAGHHRRMHRRRAGHRRLDAGHGGRRHPVSHRRRERRLHGRARRRPTSRRKWCSGTTSSSEASMPTSGTGTRPGNPWPARTARGWRAS